MGFNFLVQGLTRSLSEVVGVNNSSGIRDSTLAVVPKLSAVFRTYIHAYIHTEFRNAFSLLGTMYRKVNRFHRALNHVLSVYLLVVIGH